MKKKDVGPAKRQGGEMFAHVHITENDRAPQDRAAVRWSETFEALRDSATTDADGRSVWMALRNRGCTKIWRRMFEAKTIGPRCTGLHGRHIV
jgi:hypothetical protein